MAYGSEMLNAVNDIKTALGGTNDGGIEYGSELLNTVVDIKTIVENGGGGGELPEVDSTDNGKVLTVIDGAWAAGSGGGGGIFWVTLAWNDQEVGTLDKTYNEILTALNAGLLPIVKCVVVEEGFSSFTTAVLLGLTYQESGIGYGAEIELDPGNPVTFTSATADGVLTYDAS